MTGTRCKGKKFENAGVKFEVEGEKKKKINGCQHQIRGVFDTRVVL
jgi:hypothetical protein